MKRQSLTQYDEMPEGMIAYLRHYGPHFSRKLFEFAASKMKKEDGEKISVVTKEQTKAMLMRYGVTLENDQMYDSAYVANMCIADFLGSSVPDENHMALYVKNVIDDPDACDGLIFNRWYADMCYMGIAVDWEDML